MGSAPASSSAARMHAPRLHATVRDCAPLAVIKTACSRAGHPEPSSAAVTNEPISNSRPAPRAGAERASGALTFETIAANRAEQRDAIDAGSSRGLGHVAARLLEELRDVLPLEAFEQLGLRHAKGELLQALIRGLGLQRGPGLGRVSIQRRR